MLVFLKLGRKNTIIHSMFVETPKATVKYIKTLSTSKNPSQKFFMNLENSLNLSFRFQTFFYDFFSSRIYYLIKIILLIHFLTEKYNRNRVFIFFHLKNLLAKIK